MSSLKFLAILSVAIFANTVFKNTKRPPIAEIITIKRAIM